MTDRTSDAIVIGAGVAGLTAARELRLRGYTVAVVESADRIGGQIDRTVFDAMPDTPVDIGAEAFAVRGKEVAQLVEDLGLDVVEPAEAPSWCYAMGRAFALPKNGVLGIPSDPWAADVRAAVGTVGALRASLDRFLPQRFTDATSLDSLSRTRLGTRVTERLVAPVAGGIYSAPLDRIDIEAINPGLMKAFREQGSLLKAVQATRRSAPPGSPVRSIAGGMLRLPDALAEAITGVATGGNGPVGAIHLGRETTGIEHADGVWRVEAGDDAFRAPRLVVTTPALIDQIAPLTGRVADLVPDPQPGADVRLVTLLLRAPELDDSPRGTGMLIAPPHRDAGRRAAPSAVQAKAMTHMTAKWTTLRDQVRAAAGPGHHIVRLSYGRIGVTSEPTLEQAVADASALFGVDLKGRTLDHVVTHWRMTPPSSPSYRREVASFVERVRATDGLAVTGAWISGTGMAAVIANAISCVADL